MLRPFSEAVTCVFSHLHLLEPGFDFNSVIHLVDPEACASAAAAVKGAVETLVNRFTRVWFPHLLKLQGLAMKKTTLAMSTTSSPKTGRVVAVAPPDSSPLFLSCNVHHALWRR